MLFWTVVFFTVSLIFLVREPFKEMTIKAGELYIQKAQGKLTEKEYNEKALKSISWVFLILPLFLGEIIYLICAIKIDPIIYPSVILLAYMIINMVCNKTKKNELNTEEDIQKYRMNLYKGKTLRSIIYNLICCGYFGYIFYVLVFLK